MFGVLTVMNIGEMHAKVEVSYYTSYTGSSPIAGLVSRYHVIQVKSDNGKGVYLCTVGNLAQQACMLTLWMLSNSSCFFVVCWLFQNSHFRKILSGIPSVSNSLNSDQVRHSVQTVCKSYQHMTLKVNFFFACWVIFQAFVVRFFSNYFFAKRSFQEHFQCKTIWIQIRTNVLSVLIWVLTVCRGYQ